MNAKLVTHFNDQGKQTRTIDQYVLAFSETISYDWGFCDFTLFN